MERAQISPRQLAFLMVGFIFGSSLVVSPNTASGQDAWIANILAVAGGAVVIFVYSSLAERFPGKSLIEYSQLLFGNVGGKVVAGLYIWYFLHLAAIVTRNFGEFLVGTVLPFTPIVVTMGLLIIVCASVVRNGIEVLARCSEILVPLIFLQLFILLLLLLNVYRPESLLPVLENGWNPIIKDAWSLLAFPFGEVIAFVMVLPTLRDPKMTLKTALPAIVIAGLFLGLVTVSNLMVFGGREIQDLPFASYTASRMVSVGGFLERIEAFVVANLVIGGFIKISVLYYAGSMGIAQLFKLEDYRPIVFPTGVFIVSLAVLLYESMAEMVKFAIDIYPWYASPFQFLLPVTMLIIARVRGLAGRNLPRETQGK